MFNFYEQLQLNGQHFLKKEEYISEEMLQQLTRWLTYLSNYIVIARIGQGQVFKLATQV